MSINSKISEHIAHAMLELLDRVIIELIAQGETIMPEKMDLLFDIALAKYETAKTGIGKLQKPLCTRTTRPHLFEKCGLQACALSKKRGFRRLPIVARNRRKTSKFCSECGQKF